MCDDANEQGRMVPSGQRPVERMRPQRMESDPIGDVDHVEPVLQRVPQVVKQFDGLAAQTSDGRQE